MERDQLLQVVRNLVQQSLDARYAGGAHARLVRQSAYADGYMRALVDAGLVEQRELLALVGEQRGEATGPALGAVVAA